MANATTAMTIANMNNRLMSHLVSRICLLTLESLFFRLAHDHNFIDVGQDLTAGYTIN